MNESSSKLGNKLDVLAQSFLENEPIIPHSLETDDWAPHMGGKPFVVKSYDIAKHNNPYLVALAHGIIADARFGNPEQTTVMMDTLQVQLAEILYTKAPHMRDTRFHQELMTRIHYAIDFVMKESKGNK